MKQPKRRMKSSKEVGEMIRTGRGVIPAMNRAVRAATRPKRARPVGR
ncbi:MAG: hypothetical protein K2Q09_03225 [Phycisphaerales bacterium]|nr:hypothetical protein [Phycisphaerales bacterium]